MTRADLYRARAKEAEELAKQAREEHLKQAYLQIAREWRDLADQLERGW